MSSPAPRLLRRCPFCENRFPSRQTFRAHLSHKHDIHGKPALALLNECIIGKAAVQDTHAYKRMKRKRGQEHAPHLLLAPPPATEPGDGR